MHVCVRVCEREGETEREREEREREEGRVCIDRKRKVNLRDECTIKESLDNYIHCTVIQSLRKLYM